MSAKKSILSMPSCSISFISNCVTIASPERASGTFSLMTLPQMTTPAACMEMFLGAPSKRIAMSITFLKLSSVS